MKPESIPCPICGVWHGQPHLPATCREYLVVDRGRADYKMQALLVQVNAFSERIAEIDGKLHELDRAHAESAEQKEDGE